LKHDAGCITVSITFYMTQGMIGSHIDFSRAIEAESARMAEEPADTRGCDWVRDWRL
jgi:hypothetical protein